MKRKLSVILMIYFLITFLCPDCVLAEAQLPPGTQEFNKKGLPLNQKLWLDKGIIVYGDWSSVAGGNDFKEGTQVNGVANPDGGYYIRNGVKGEYRYHGYDYNHNKYTNINFINDANSNRALVQKNWLYRPWDNNFIVPKVNRSDYSRAAIDHGDHDTQVWINRTIDFPITNGIDGDGSHASSTQPYDYLHVMSPPTTMTHGEGRMWHRTSGGRIWYQTFTVPRVAKKPNDTSISVEVDSGNIIIPTNADPARNNDTVEVRVMVRGDLLDEDIYNDDIRRVTNYCRYDVSTWNITLNTSKASVAKAEYTRESGEVHFTLRYTVAEIMSMPYDPEAKMYFASVRAREQAVYADNNKSLARESLITIPFGGQAIIEPQPVPQRPEPDDPMTAPPPIVVEPDPHLPHPAFDIVPYPARDDTDMSQCVQREVFINGREVSDSLFFSGGYVFGEGNHGLARIDVYYTSVDGTGSLVTRWIYVYDTKPRAQFKFEGSYKQNRKMKLTENSDEANDEPVISRYPINSYRWRFSTIEGDGDSMRMRDISELYKELLYKEPGTYRIELIVGNTLGRVSEPYTLTFIIREDIPAAVICNLDNSVLQRDEEISAYAYDAVSTDGDIVSGNKLELYYDSDNNGTYDLLLNTWNGLAEFPAFRASMLGSYKFVNTVTEEFGEDTLEEFAGEADRKVKTVEREFLVDNCVPMTGIYVDIPVVRPEIDVYVMMDENLNASEVSWIVNNRMNMENSLRTRNILPRIELWDMKTYTYSQPANAAVNTGSAYPPETASYSSNGYLGILSRTNVADNGSYHDFGSYKTRTEKKTFTASHSNTVTNYWDENGTLIRTTDSSPAPSSKSINKDGYHGSIPRTGTTGPTNQSTTYWPNGKKKTYKRTYTAHYSGTLSKTVKYWDPDWQWVPDYTGFYSGTIYKDIRQPYVDPYRPTSDKYVVYISSRSISEPDDLRDVLERADAKLILIGAEDMEGLIAHEHFILNNSRPAEALMNEALAYITENNRAVEKLYVLADLDTFNLSTADYDEENDPIVESGFQYVQNPHYFDNSTGMESFAAESFDEDSGWTGFKADRFEKSGEFRVYRRIRDNPSADPDFSGFSYYSGMPELLIYSHRKPIASAMLDWDFDPVSGLYDVSFTDASYDPDHQYSREDRGIVERKTVYRQTGGEWRYSTPERLESGSYELQYHVRDPEGVWSDPFIMNFTLGERPDIQLEADLRALDGDFSTTAGIPASEFLEAFDIWTRYPYELRLEMALYDGSSRAAPLIRIDYGTSAGVRVENDTWWNNVNYQIPASLPDKPYIFKISAVDVNNPSIRAERNFTVNVSTPVGLVPDMPEKLIIGSLYDNIRASTAKYANVTQVTLFYGTEHQGTFTMTGGSPENGRKLWSLNYAVPHDIPAGSYLARFRATTPNGNSQAVVVPFDVESFKITGVTIEGYWNHWRGQVDMFGKPLANEPHRFLSMETVKINVFTTGFADKVVIRFSPELEAMTFTDVFGNIYDYAEYFGRHIDFPDDATFMLDSGELEGHVYWEYTLPLAQSTKSWDDLRLGEHYIMTVIAYKGEDCVTYEIDDIDITGNVYDLTYIQPLN